MRGRTAAQAMSAYNMRPNEKWIFPRHETYLFCIPSAPCRKKVVEGTRPRTKVVEDVENGDGGGDDEEWALRRNSPTRRWRHPERRLPNLAPPQRRGPMENDEKTAGMDKGCILFYIRTHIDRREKRQNKSTTKTSQHQQQQVNNITSQREQQKQQVNDNNKSITTTSTSSQ